MKIPKRIKVGKHKYNIEMRRHSDYKQTMGTTCYDTNTIIIGKRCTVTDKKFPPNEIYDTFWHELTHTILRDMKHPLDDNEKFVTGFANRLTKAILSAEF